MGRDEFFRRLNELGDAYYKLTKWNESLRDKLTLEGAWPEYTKSDVAMYVEQAEYWAKKYENACKVTEYWAKRYGDAEKNTLEARKLTEEWRDHAEFLANKYDDWCVNPPPQLPWEVE